MKNLRPKLIEGAVVAFCIWQAADLPHNWLSFPFLHLSWLAFLLWIVPIILYWIPLGATQEKQTTPLLLWLALLSSLIGMLGSLHALQHVGLVLALAAMMPWTSWLSVIWILSAIAWLPATTYFFVNFSLQTVTIGRLIIAFIGSLAGFLAILKKK